MKNTLRFPEADPIALLPRLDGATRIEGKRPCEILDVSKGLISDILNYKKGLSKEIIRKLADHFKVSQEAFNRPYKLKVVKNVKSGRRWFKTLTT